MNQRVLAILAVFTATIIYGVTFTIAKDVIGSYIKPFGLIVLRVLGASVLFWLIGLFVKAKSIEKQDFKTVAVCAFFGVGLNMLCFFKGISYTTPISAAVMMVSAPIMVLVISSILTKEKVGLKKVIGIFIGLIGAIVLIVQGGKGTSANAENMMLGNFLVFVNATSYAVFLVVSKKMIAKYNPIVFVKWMYLFGLFFVIPFGFSELQEVQWQMMPNTIYLKTGFIVVFTTCITYLCNLYGLSKLKSTTVSVFIYLQPVIAAIHAISVGSDRLDVVKIVSTLFIFLGVFLVTKK